MSTSDIVIFQIYGQFRKSGSRIPDALSMKLTFSLIVTFMLQKLKTKIKKFFNTTLIILYYFK